MDVAAYRKSLKRSTQKRSARPPVTGNSPRVAQYENAAREVWRLAVAMNDNVAKIKERVTAVCVRDFGTAVWHYDHVLAYVMRLHDASRSSGV